MACLGAFAAQHPAARDYLLQNNGLAPLLRFANPTLPLGMLRKVRIPKIAYLGRKWLALIMAACVRCRLCWRAWLATRIRPGEYQMYFGCVSVRLCLCVCMCAIFVCNCH